VTIDLRKRFNLFVECKRRTWRLHEVLACDLMARTNISLNLMHLNFDVELDSYIDNVLTDSHSYCANI
jgi:hypothetical protein